MFNANNATQRYVAYCIQPDVDVQPGATYTASYNFTPSADVRKLYESSFASTVGNAEKQKAFQLALWELQNDDNNLSYVDANSKQYFAAGQSPTVDMAAAMLVSASNYTLGVNHYSYVTFEGNANGVESQQLLGVREVTAVPEADTWAMMAVGLGLVGLVGRRKQKNEKFA
ncbi:PEP-CTERM sorting domain-containing protein [Pseudoduganella danionis]|uniref:PEP-CTERM sorting domain-containing protein n=2 Tax=Pseudoduganella danionis TaxID=1890295 RepID=A0ABW9SKT2_9BURK|nr:PEP-CTERM sorting domain-containing protein [Pseudoduganella danionis]